MNAFTASTSVTLADVASAAGVGESTVSRVLRKHGSFSPKTEARVMEAVARLGYVPNRIAGTLASSGSQLLAVIIPSLANIVFADLLRGLSGLLDETRRQAVFAVTEYDLQREETAVAAMLAWRPAAVVLAGLEHTDTTIRMLRSNGCRVVEVLDTDGPALDLAVGYSNAEAGRASARYLLERGYRRIGYIGHDLLRDKRAGKRYAGFCATLGEAGVALADQLIDGVGSSVALGRRGLASMLGRSRSLDAVYFSNDDMAIGGYFHCLAEGIAITEQLALFGYNGLDLVAATPTPLSTIRTPRVKVGQVAAELVLANAAPQIVDLGFELIIGATA